MRLPSVPRRTLLVAWLVLAVAPLSVAQPKPSIILATTTSTQDSGLLDALVPRFEKERGIEVKTIAAGTGAALRMAGSGDADVVLVHAPASERPYVEAGHLIDGLIGPQIRKLLAQSWRRARRLGGVREWPGQ